MLHRTIALDVPQPLRAVWAATRPLLFRAFARAALRLDALWIEGVLRGRKTHGPRSLAPWQLPPNAATPTFRPASV